MTGLWFLPFLVMTLLGAVFALCARERARGNTPEQELRELVRADSLSSLTASLRTRPAPVLSSRCSAIRNRVVLDLGDVELEVCCYSPPRSPIDAVHAVYYRSSVGWVVETTGRGGAHRLHGWLLDVRARRRHRGGAGA